MDPDANLREQQALVAEITRLGECPQAIPLHQEAVRLSVLVEALDEWLRNGGALPRAWSR